MKIKKFRAIEKAFSNQKDYEQWKESNNLEIFVFDDEISDPDTDVILYSTINGIGYETEIIQNCPDILAAGNLMYEYYIEKEHDSDVIEIQVDAFQYFDIDADAIADLRKMNNPVAFIYLHLSTREIVGVGVLYCENTDNQSNFPEQNDDLNSAIEKLIEMEEIQL